MAELKLVTHPMPPNLPAFLKLFSSLSSRSLPLSATPPQNCFGKLKEMFTTLSEGAIQHAMAGELNMEATEALCIDSVAGCADGVSSA